MRAYLFGLAISAALAVGMPVRAEEEQRDAVPKLDHVFVIVLENHNSFTSFGSNGIIGNPQAPNITALWNKYNVATNYNAVWHPSLPNYVGMITGNWVGTDVIATGHSYAPGSTVGISDDDSASISTDYPTREYVVPPLDRQAAIACRPVGQRS
jgi:phosphatidylinositol-3-phosphatase